ncbi:synaptonemal complex central element protein 1 isoform X1 [Gadus chalcogrammus]|uniref:synaptonemal complex central element protein 1 isoform X1 n=1 Tax=Gadus chalcogrammus TaxID=1042646 RepID=UPI0024C4E51D|nr:synaptonemal complex central element protein 1 isoform X1 [Gadus chalcogrammus]
MTLFQPICVILVRVLSRMFVISSPKNWPLTETSPIPSQFMMPCWKNWQIYELKLTNSKLRTETKKSHAGFCSSNAESQSRNPLVSVCRQLQLNRQSEETLEQYRCQIQELKLKHRKLRMKFENQLNQLIEQHKNLLTIFTPERLPSEIESAQNSKCQLLATEILKVAQLNILEEEV